MLIVIGDPDRHPCVGATQIIESFNPKQILALLQQLHPAQTAAIEERNQQLESQEDRE